MAHFSTSQQQRHARWGVSFLRRWRGAAALPLVGGGFVLLRQEVPVLRKKVAPLPPVLLPDVVQGCEAPDVPDAQQGGFFFHNELDERKLWLGRPKGIVQSGPSKVIPDQQ